MSLPTTTPEELIDQAIADYVLAEQAGRAPSRDAWLAAHASIAAELADFLDDRARFASAIRPIREAVGAGSTGADLPTIAVASGATDTDVPLEPATVVGEYRLIAEIARGGMGVVYKAHHERLNRVVALKMVLPARLGSLSDIERFYAEARAAAKLSDPHIVPIYEIGEYHGRPFFSMEFVAGGSLREHMERFAKDPRATATLLAIAARAVHHAHQRGILHRDLKPGNILIDEQGQPHVTDFGLAKRLGADDGLTAAGGIVGTPSYMSPEQAGGRSDLTTAADIYSLGAVLYELLTGRPPFRGSTPVETMMQVVVQDAPAPRSIQADVDPELEAICLKCLEREPERRYGTAAELADDLDRWLAGEPTLAKPATMLEQTAKWSRRHPVLAGSLGTAALLAIALLIASGLSWHNAELRAQAVANLDEANQKLTQVKQEVKTTEQQIQELRAEAKKHKEAAEVAEQKLRMVIDDANKEHEKAEVARKEAKAAAKARARAEAGIKVAEERANRTLYAADMQLAHAAWKSENLSTYNELLERQKPTPGATDLRGFEWNYLWRLGHRERLNIKQTEQTEAFNPIYGLDISPDGTRLAAASAGAVKIWDLKNGKLLKELQFIAGAKPANPLADPVAFGFKVFLGGEYQIVSVMFAEEGDKVRVALRKKNVGDFMMKTVVPAYAKKEKGTLAMVAAQLEMREISLQGEAEAKSIPVDFAQLSRPVSAMLAGSLFFTHDGDIMTISSTVRSPNGKRLVMCGIKVEPDPGKLQAGQRPITGGLAALWDMETKSVARVLKLDGVCTSAAFSADDQYLAIGTSQGPMLYDLSKLDEPRKMDGQTTSPQALGFSADSKRLAAGDMTGAIHLWDVASGKEIAALRGHLSQPIQLIFSRDGAELVTATAQGEVKAWNLSHTENVVTINEHQGIINSLAFTDDSSKLFAADSKGKVASYDAASGETLTTANAKGATLQTAALSAKATWYAASVKDSILIRDLKTGGETKIDTKGLFMFKLAFSPDEKYLVGTAITGESGLWRTDTWEKAAMITEKGPFATSAAFSPKGNEVALLIGNNVTFYDLAKKTKRNLLPEPLQGFATTLAWSTRGDLLAIGATGQIRVYDAASGEEKLRIGATGRETSALCFSPDDRRLAAVSQSSVVQSTAKLFDISSGRELISLEVARGICMAIAFSPDGRRFAAASTEATDPLAMITEPNTRKAKIQIWDAPPVRE